MKILMFAMGAVITGKQTGGTKRFIELMNYLKSVHNVTLCSTESPETSINGVKQISLKESKRKGFSLIAQTMRLYIKNRYIIKKIKHDAYDAVIAFDVPPAVWLCIRGVKNVILMIRQDLIGYKEINLNNHSIKGFKRLLFMKALHYSEGICLKKAKLIIVQCEYDKQILINRHKNVKAKIEEKTVVQINNVNPSWIVENSKINTHTRDSNVFSVGYIGNFDSERKGYKIFLEAVQELTDENIILEADVIGGGTLLQDAMESCKGYKNIRFHGYMNNPIERIKSCDLIVVPSLADSCPNTIMEALYNKIPVIASDVGGIPEILDGCSATFTPNTQALTNILRDMINPEKLVTLAACEKQRRMDLTFNWQEKINAIISIKMHWESD